MHPARRQFQHQKDYKKEDQEGELIRVRTPRDKESLGIVEQRLGASRMKINCFDGFARICRIPGRLKRKLWVREGDIVLVEPWEYGENDKGDIIFKYKPNQIDWLKSHGFLKKLDNIEEF